MRYEKINIELPTSAKDYLDYLHTIKNKSDGTTSGYDSNLREFFNYILKSKNKRKITDKTLKELTLNDLYKYMAYTEKELKNSPNTRARKVACLKSYFKYAYKKAKAVPENIAEELEMPKIPETVPVCMTIDESKKMFESLDDWDQNYHRNKCILAIFFNCGLRLSELKNIKLTDIKNNRLVVNGKGSKQRTITLNSSCIKTIEEYLKNRKDDRASEEDKQYLFLSQRQQQMSDSVIRVMFKKYIKEAGLDEKYHVHTARHSFATNTYNQGVDVIKLSKLLGHTNVNTSKIYITMNEEAEKEILENNPMNIL